MQSYYDAHDVKFLCNTRNDVLSHALSMYRQPMARGQSLNYQPIRNHLNKLLAERDSAKVIIPASLLQHRHGHQTNVSDAECTAGRILFARRYGKGDPVMDVYAYNCAQNISFEAFRTWYRRATNAMKKVNAMCLDYMERKGESSVHWINYEEAQRSPQRSIRAAGDFLSGFASAERKQLAAEEDAAGDLSSQVKGATRHKLGSDGGLESLLQTVPNFEHVLTEYWSRQYCVWAPPNVTTPSFVSYQPGAGIISAHSLLKLLFDTDPTCKYCQRVIPGTGAEPPFVAFGSGASWLSRLFALDKHVNHVVVQGQDATRVATNESSNHGVDVRCDGGCGEACLNTTDSLLSARRNIQTQGTVSTPDVSGILIKAHSLTAWDSPPGDFNSIVAEMARAKVRVICAVWENTIEGGLALLHEDRLRHTSTKLRDKCSAWPPTSPNMPKECIDVHTVTTNQLRSAANRVAIETFATLRFCQMYSKAVGADNVLVVAHRAADASGVKAGDGRATVDRIARFIGVPPWPSKDDATRCVVGSHHRRFFRDVLPTLRNVLHNEVYSGHNMLQVCEGCDAYSVADTIEMITPVDANS